MLVFYLLNYDLIWISIFPANPLNTPLNILPEWYFLLFYGCLRSIPPKTIGVIIVLIFVILCSSIYWIVQTMYLIQINGLCWILECYTIIFIFFHCFDEIQSFFYYICLTSSFIFYIEYESCIITFFFRHLSFISLLCSLSYFNWC